jgi:putative peptide zinc metalloprotease protein
MTVHELHLDTASRVELHHLQQRRDGDEYIVGRVDTGDFIAVPEIGAQAITLLAGGMTVGAASHELSDRFGTDLDLVDLLSGLVDVGFVAEVDGRPVPSPPPIEPTFPRLQPRHVAWTLHPALHALVGLVILAGCLLAAVGAGAGWLPTPADLLWSDRGSLVLLGQSAIAWTSLLAHELAHLATARAAAIPARMGFGTRLQFLVAQTDVTGIWIAPRRMRLTVYLSGMAVELVIATGALAGIAVVGAGGTASDILSVVVVTQLLALATQCMVFMRTDLYFVLQDVTRSRNLYGDGAAYVLYLGRRAIRRRPPDPSRALPAHERRAVRAYALLLAVGTVACLAAFAVYTLPITLTLLGRALSALATGPGWSSRLDGLVVLTLLGTVQVLWFRAWWRRHAARLRRQRRAQP